EHRRRTAGVDLDVIAEPLLKQVGHEAVVPDAAVIGGHGRVVQKDGTGCVLGVPEPEEGLRVRPELVLPDGQRRDARPAAHQQRLTAVPWFGEAVAERPDQQEFLAGLELAEPVRAGADVLDQEMQLAAARPEHAERARKERTLALASAPPLGGGEHVELAGSWRRTGR